MHAIRVARTVTPDRDALVVENMKRAIDDAADGDWPDASAAFQAARSDAARPPGTPRTVFGSVASGSR